MYLVIGRANCTFCEQAKELLTRQGKTYIYVDLAANGQEESNAVWRDILLSKMKVKTVPQVFKLTGSFEDLKKELANE